MTHRNRSAGFTLLELLVAIALFAVLAAMAYGGLNALLEARGATEREMARLAALQKGFALLQQDVEQAVARPVRDAQGDRQPALIARGGDAVPALELTRTGWLDPAQPDGERLLRVGYHLEDGRLWRSAWPVLDRAPGARPQSRVVLEEVTGLRLRFRIPGGDWVTVWPAAQVAPESLPAAVEITLVFKHWGPMQRVFRVPHV